MEELLRTEPARSKQGSLQTRVFACEVHNGQPPNPCCKIWIMAKAAPSSNCIHNVDIRYLESAAPMDASTVGARLSHNHCHQQMLGLRGTIEWFAIENYLRCSTACMPIIDSEPIKSCLLHLVIVEHILHLHIIMSGPELNVLRQGCVSRKVFDPVYNNSHEPILRSYLASSLCRQSSLLSCSVVQTTFQNFFSFTTSDSPHLNQKLLRFDSKDGSQQLQERIGPNFWKKSAFAIAERQYLLLSKQTGSGASFNDPCKLNCK
jgi:hypothetical protein